MLRINVVTTGGTIEKMYSEQSGVVLNAASKIGLYLTRLRLPDCEVRVHPVMNKDSLEMTTDDRAVLVAALEPLVAEGNPVVITHGTDTMVETGIFIQRALVGLAVPIILTGAMAPLGFEYSDGLQNLTESLLAARLLGPGVYVVIHSQVFPVDSVRKNRELGTFVSTLGDGAPASIE
jgi:L-asparaginase